MKNSKLLELIRTFNREEFKLLGKFIESPYFGGLRDCTPLYNALKRYYPKLDEKDVMKEKIFSEAFPGKKYDGKNSDTLLLTVSSYMYKLCKEFLVYIELNEEKVQREHMLLKQLNKRKLFKEFNREYEKISSGRPREELNNNDFLNNFELLLQYGESCKAQGNMKGLFESYKSSSDNLLAYALIGGCRFIDVKFVGFDFNIDVGYNFTESLMSSLNTSELLEKMKLNDDTSYPYVAANIMVYKMVTERDDISHYEKLKDLVKVYDEKFGHHDKYILYSILASYIIYKESRHHTKELTLELFKIYKRAYERGVYKPSFADDFDPTIYRNIVSTAIDAGEFEWAEEFINKASGELPSEQAEGMKDYSFANLYFIKGEFERALTYAVNIKYDYFLHKINAKVLQFKIYYELKNYEQCYSVIDTTKHYISSTKEIGEIYRERNSSFLKYAGDLVKNAAGNNKDIGFILEKLRNEKSTESKNWLISKLEKLGEKVLFH